MPGPSSLQAYALKRQCGPPKEAKRREMEGEKLHFGGVKQKWEDRAASAELGLAGMNQ